MTTNVANIIGGPALVQFGGASFYSKGDIRLEPTLETFPIEVDAFQQVDERVAQTPVRLTFTPAGAWAALAVLFPYANILLGDLITPWRTFDTVNAAANSVAIAGHRLRAGMAVRLTTSGTLPAGLSAATLYYVGVIDAGNVSFHATYAAAIALTSPIDITDAGTGEHKLLQQEPLVIHTFSGQKFTFHNAAVVGMPKIIAGATKTLLGEVSFEAFRKNNTAINAANAIFTQSSATFTDTSFDPAGILTQPYSGIWGATPPWDDFATKEGFEVDARLTLEPVETDADGILSRRLVGIDVSAAAQPIGISESALLAKLLLQDTGAGRGRSLSGDNLNISAAGVYIRIYGAALLGGPQSFSARTYRIGQLQWKATRTFAAGVPNPLFYVGTAAP